MEWGNQRCGLIIQALEGIWKKGTEAIDKYVAQ
jgi:hypothetical protein